MAEVIERARVQQLVNVRRAIDEMAKLDEVVCETGWGFKVNAYRSDERGSLVPTLLEARPLSFVVVKVNCDYQEDAVTVPLTVTVANIEATERELTAGLALKFMGWASPLQSKLIQGEGGERGFTFEVPTAFLRRGYSLYFSGMHNILIKVNFDYEISDLLPPLPPEPEEPEPEPPPQDQKSKRRRI